MIFGINTTCDIWKLLIYVISRAVRPVIFGIILKYHKWYLCQISRTNRVCLNVAGRDSRVEVAGAGAGAGARKGRGLT